MFKTDSKYLISGTHQFWEYSKWEDHFRMSVSLWMPEKSEIEYMIVAENQYHLDWIDKMLDKNLHPDYASYLFLRGYCIYFKRWRDRISDYINRKNREEDLNDWFTNKSVFARPMPFRN